MSDSKRLAKYVEAWREACRDFLDLARNLPDDAWDLPTDLPGWTVGDVVRHTAHLEAVLAGATEETEPAPDAPHAQSLMGAYTEQGVHARRRRTHAEVLDELEQAVAKRSRALADDPPTDPDGSPPRTPGGIPWTWQTLLGNRVLDVWMHEQDVRRAVGKPGGMRAVAARHVVDTFLRAMPMVIAKRAQAPAEATVVVELVDAGTLAPFGTGSDGRVHLLGSAPGHPTVQLRMSAETFTLLAGGRRTPDQVDVEIIGDKELGRRILGSLAVTP